MRKFSLLSLILVLGLVGCKDEGQRHYRVAREESQAVMPGQMPGAKAGESGGNEAELGLERQTAAFGQPEWEVPGHWVEMPLGALRKGSFEVKAEGERVEISVLVFPGDVGGTLANINRWAGQVEAPEWDEGVLASAERMEVDGAEGVRVELFGPKQVVRAVIVERAAETWFFKLLGDADLAKVESDGFYEFVGSVRFPKKEGGE